MDKKKEREKGKSIETLERAGEIEKRTPRGSVDVSFLPMSRMILIKSSTEEDAL